MSKNGVKIIKPSVDTRHDDNDYVPKRLRHSEGDSHIKRHELSLLSLLVEKHPERAREFLNRLQNSLAKPQDVV